MATLNKITSLAEADLLLSEYATLQHKIEGNATRAIERQTRITEETAATNAPMIERRDAIEQQLHAWFKTQEKDLHGVRSIKLSAGTLKAHTKPVVKTIKGWNFEKALTAMQAAGKKWADFLRPKTVINKQAILDDATVHGDALAAVGLRIGKSESFSIKLDPGDVKERAA